MSTPTAWRAAVLAIASLALLGGCAGVRLQSAEQAVAQVYSSVQSKARADCIQRSSPTDATGCQRQRDRSYDDYTQAREKLQRPEPATLPAHQ